MVSLEARFMAKVNAAGSCWEWTASKSAGYGKMVVRGRLVLAHRVSWELARGPIPDGMCVLHRCDNRACVNPEHLFLGTKKDNTQDMWRKGRGSRNGAGASQVRGERHGSARLSALQVVEIRKLSAEGVSLSELCKRFGVASVGGMSQIVRGKRWRHV